MAMALPDGFEWRPFMDGKALYCGDRQVADACEASPGNGWRMSLTGGSGPPRYVFLDDEAACVRYAERWALKWVERIRSFGTEVPLLGAGAGPLGRTGPPVQTTHPRGGKSRRRGPLG